jgi:hypothetical protein
VRESRRILGQHILTEDDLMKSRRFDDAIATGCWYLDIHPNKTVVGSANDFDPKKHQPEPYDIPYRSLVPQKASNLLNIELEIETAVGEGTASEFYAYQSIYSRLPDIDSILNGGDVPVPIEPSLMYAVTGALVARSKSAQQYFNGFKWLRGGTTDDYTGLFLDDALVAMESKGQLAAFAKAMKGDEDSKAFRQRYQEFTRGV